MQMVCELRTPKHRGEQESFFRIFVSDDVVNFQLYQNASQSQPGGVGRNTTTL